MKHGDGSLGGQSEVPFRVKKAQLALMSQLCLCCFLGRKPTREIFDCQRRIKVAAPSQSDSGQILFLLDSKDVIVNDFHDSLRPIALATSFFSCFRSMRTVPVYTIEN